MQASLLVPLVQQLLKEYQMTLSQCAAVGISAGPGSYTGLRVGVSTAKGLCFGANKPLISINSLEVISQNCIDFLSTKDAFPPDSMIVPMIDAHRMEVYTAKYSLGGGEISPTEAKIIDTESFREELALGKVIFTGDGAEKCRSLLEHPNAHFVPLSPSAEGLRFAAYRAFQQKKFEDLAYFEPFYLKDFITNRALQLPLPTDP